MKEKVRLQIIVLWLLLSIGFILHNGYHLAEMFFGIDIKNPEANGEIPTSVHLFKILLELPLLVIILASLYTTSKTFLRFSFVWSLLLCLVNGWHCIETLQHESSDFSQVALLLIVFIVNFTLVLWLYAVCLPWQFLPKKLREWNWAKHQQYWYGKWHLYLGLIAGSILVVVGLTGSILVFQDEIDSALNPELFEVKPTQQRIPMAEMANLVRQRYPDRKFNYVNITNDDVPNSTYQFRDLEAKTEFFVNPYTGEICGKRLTNSSFIRTVMNIHMTLLIPEVGKYIVGFSALCLLILTITGIRLWLPANIRKWKQWKEALTVKLGASFKRQNLDWHNVLGFYSAPVVVVLSLTGFVITFNSMFIGFMFMLNGKSPDALQQIFDNKSVYQPTVQKLSAKEIITKAGKPYKNAYLESIAFPKDSLGTYMLMYNAPGTAKTGHLTMMAVDQYSGKVLMNSNRDFPPVGASYVNWTIPLHYGTFGGWPTRILACLGGLIPLAMYITGFIIWWPRLKKRQKSGEKVLTAHQIAKAKVKIHEKRLHHLPLATYCLHHFKKGLKYGLYLLVCSAVCAILYGLLSGIVIAPTLYVVYYIGIAVLVNFVVALSVLLFQTLFLLPFGKSYRKLYKYAVWSVSVLLVFVPIIYLVNNHLGLLFI